MGFVISYFFDWPTGATDAALACLLLGILALGQWIVRHVSTLHKLIWSNANIFFQSILFPIGGASLLNVFF